MAQFMFAWNWKFTLYSLQTFKDVDKIFFFFLHFCTFRNSSCDQLNLCHYHWTLRNDFFPSMHNNKVEMSNSIAGFSPLALFPIVRNNRRINVDANRGYRVITVLWFRAIWHKVSSKIAQKWMGGLKNVFILENRLTCVDILVVWFILFT